MQFQISVFDEKKMLCAFCNLFLKHIHLVLLGLKKIIVWLSSTTFFQKGRVGGPFFFFFFLDFFFKSKSKLHEIIASISPNKGGKKSTLPKYIFIQA